MTSTWNSRRTFSGRYVVLVMAVFVLLGLAGGYVALVIGRPLGSPIASMYRTEADLRSLITAVEAYRHDMGIYPPAGAGGLRMATDYMSRNAPYMPNGPPFDGWKQPYRYVTSDAYAQPDSEALRGNGAYYAPNTFQIYSVGADGDAGLTDDVKQRDNITSWDASRSWRAVYRDLQHHYFETHLDKESKKDVP